MATMTGYNVPAAVRGEVNLPDHGTVAFEWAAGHREPKDEVEAAVLEWAAATGLVEPVAAKPAVKAKAAKPEPASEDKE